MTQTPEIDAPRAGTKEAALVEALRGKGQTLQQLSSLLDWQPHTIRAALTRLRKRGYSIERAPRTQRSASRFRITQAHG